MKTNLPQAINSIEEAKAFLTALHDNGEAFHPENDAHDIIWNDTVVTLEEANRLNILMGYIYDLPGNDGRHIEPMIFDPCQFLVDIDKYKNYIIDNGLDDDSNSLSYEELHNFVIEYIEVDETEAMKDCVEDEDDRIFSAADMENFAIRMVLYALDNETYRMSSQIIDYIREEVKFETGDDSF